MINRIALVGMVSKNGVELRYSQAGKAVSKFMLGVKRNFKNQSGEYDWDNVAVEIWGPSAEYVANHAVEKSMVAVDGSLRIDRVEKDGNVRYYTKVIANEVQIITKPENSGFGHEEDMDSESIPF